MKTKHAVIILLVVSLLIVGAIVIRYGTAHSEKVSIAPHYERLGPPSAYPDQVRTPGVTDPDITQKNIAETICNPQWHTRTIRPPSSYTSKLKREQIAALHLSGTTRDYEEDHLIPLELGGAPKDPRNLWPEPYDEPGARQKDTVERYLHDRVCSGDMTLADAQHQVLIDWYRVYLDIQKPRVVREK